jgi:ketosteroid isomerase-like protein
MAKPITDFADVTPRSREALGMIAKGNTEGYVALWSRRDDITLGNPFGGFARGWDQVVEQMERAASHYRDGETTSFEMISEVAAGNLAYTVEIERFRARVGGSREMSELALRVTCVYRREEEGWKLVHRHADPRVTRQSADSVLPR